MTPAGCERFLHQAVPDGLDVDHRKWNCLPPDTLPFCTPECILEQTRWLRYYLADRDDDVQRFAVTTVVLRGWREALWQMDLPEKPAIPDEIPTLRAARKVIDEIADWCVRQLRLDRTPSTNDGDDQPPGGWSKPDSPTRWAGVFGESPKTFMRKVNQGKIRAKKLTSKSYQIAVDDLPASEKPKHLPRGK
jgi:hypothetical protein